MLNLFWLLDISSDERKKTKHKVNVTYQKTIPQIKRLDPLTYIFFLFVESNPALLPSKT